VSIEKHKKYNTATLIVAAGSGLRFGSSMPKQFFEINGMSLLEITLVSFVRFGLEGPLVVTFGKGMEEKVTSIISKIPWHGIKKAIKGGRTRQESVFNGLQWLESQKPDYVLIHDSVRPFVDHEIVSVVMEGALSFKAAIPAVPVSDTLKRITEDNIVIETVAREDLWQAQTPQAFLFEHIFNAHKHCRKNGFKATDDASVLEHIGSPVKIVPGSSNNFKITTSGDMKLAKAILSMEG